MASFQPLANPFVISCTPSSASTAVAISGDSRYIEGASSVMVINTCDCWIRIKASAGTFIPVTDTTGMIIGPGVMAVLGAQSRTDNISVMSVTRQGIPASTGNVEVTYGGGD